MMGDLPELQVLHHFFRYDADTGILYRKVDYWSAKAGYRADMPGSRGYRRVKFRGKTYIAHRLIWKMQTGEEPNCQIDHKNRVRDDNRWINLREATPSQNGRNMFREKRSNLPRGVTYTGRNYQAQIKVEGRQVYLGVFKTASAAAEAYGAAVNKYHGEYALGYGATE